MRRGALAILAFGVALRLVRYFADRSLWLDESLLTINLMTRSYRELLETLDYNQGAPIAFLWIERLMLDLFGDSEYSLRVFPLLIGICSLILFYLVVRELLTPVGSLVALLLFATIEPFVRYSPKRSSTGWTSPSPSASSISSCDWSRAASSADGRRCLAVVGPLAVSLSHPSAFVLSGLAIGGLYAAVSSRNVTGLGPASNRLRDLAPVVPRCLSRGDPGPGRSPGHRPWHRSHPTREGQEPVHDFQ